MAFTHHLEPAGPLCNWLYWFSNSACCCSCCNHGKGQAFLSSAVAAAPWLLVQQDIASPAAAWILAKLLLLHSFVLNIQVHGLATLMQPVLLQPSIAQACKQP